MKRIFLSVLLMISVDTYSCAVGYAGSKLPGNDFIPFISMGWANAVIPSLEKDENGDNKRFRFSCDWQGRSPAFGFRNTDGSEYIFDTTQSLQATGEDKGSNVEIEIHRGKSVLNYTRDGSKHRVQLECIKTATFGRAERYPSPGKMVITWYEGKKMRRKFIVPDRNPRAPMLRSAMGSPRPTTLDASKEKIRESTDADDGKTYRVSTGGCMALGMTEIKEKEGAVEESASGARNK